MMACNCHCLQMQILEYSCSSGSRRDQQGVGLGWEKVLNVPCGYFVQVNNIWWQKEPCNAVVHLVSVASCGWLHRTSR